MERTLSIVKTKFEKSQKKLFFKGEEKESSLRSYLPNLNWKMTDGKQKVEIGWSAEIKSTTEIGWRSEILGQSTTINPTTTTAISTTDPLFNRRCSTSSNSNSTPSSSCASESSLSLSDDGKRRERKRKKLEKREKRKEKKKMKKEEKFKRREMKRERKRLKKLSKNDKKSKKGKNYKTENELDFSIPIDLMTATNMMKPETPEEYATRQNKIRREIDPQTGRSRLVKGDGEILEEIVSRERHLEINRHANKADSEYFQLNTTG